MITSGGPRAVLVGLPGTGKSTTGRRLARMLSVQFADSDHLVEVATGTGIAELFAERGEAAFRAAEAAAIADALVSFDGVLSLGGGALLDDNTRRAVKGCGAPVVLLLASIDCLVERVGDAESRPLLAGDPAGRLRQLAGDRAPAYDAVATLRIDSTGRTPGQVAALIAARLPRGQRGARKATTGTTKESR